ncbi:MAG: cell envelope integrity EipB family protein [Alphaproteobacteria bacterium]|nr:cell envelope integrity EipB family protein [Alphaproteobacteria bacterium]
MLALVPGVLAADLVPHLAEYALSLKSAKQGSGIAALKGRMQFRFADVCDGWTVENRTVMSFLEAEGEEVETQWSFVTWEAKDGLSYRFRVTSLRNGDMVQEIQGQASLEAPGGPGKVRLTKPEERTIRLPKGTLFPSAHTKLILSEAALGKTSLQRVVYDGASLDSPQEVNALIGSPRKPQAKPSNPLLAGASWPSHMAFFDIKAKDGLPAYELSLRYFENGIADDVIEDYGNFSVRSLLSKIDPLPRPDC